MTLNLVATERSVTRYSHVKYTGLKSYQSKDMANVKVFADKQIDKLTDGQTDGPKTICPDLLTWGHNN